MHTLYLTSKEKTYGNFIQNEDALTFLKKRQWEQSGTGKHFTKGRLLVEIRSGYGDISLNRFPGETTYQRAKNQVL